MQDDRPEEDARRPGARRLGFALCCLANHFGPGLIDGLKADAAMVHIARRLARWHAARARRHTAPPGRTRAPTMISQSISTTSPNSRGVAILNRTPWCCGQRIPVRLMTT